MSNLHKRIFQRKDNKNLIIYSREKHKEKKENRQKNITKEWLCEETIFV